MLYVFLAEGFEEIETISTVDILRRAGLETQMVGVGATQVTGTHGITVTADLIDASIDIKSAKGIVLPGGMPGTHNLEKSPAVQAAIDHCAAQGLLIAAICAAPSILGHKGLLKGVPATAFGSYVNELNGAITVNAPLARHKNFITARSAGFTMDFALSIVEYFKGPQVAMTLHKSLHGM